MDADPIVRSEFREMQGEVVALVEVNFVQSTRSSASGLSRWSPSMNLPNPLPSILSSGSPNNTLFARFDVLLRSEINVFGMHQSFALPRLTALTFEESYRGAGRPNHGPRKGCGFRELAGQTWPRPDKKTCVVQLVSGLGVKPPHGRGS